METTTEKSQSIEQLAARTKARAQQIFDDQKKNQTSTTKGESKVRLHVEGAIAHYQMERLLDYCREEGFAYSFYRSGKGITFDLYLI